MVIYILRIKMRHYDQEMQEYDEEKDEEYFLWALNEQTIVNKMRKWKPPRVAGQSVDVTRDTIWRQKDKRTVDYFVENEDGSTDLIVAELSVEPCVSVDDAVVRRIFEFA